MKIFLFFILLTSGSYAISQNVSDSTYSENFVASDSIANKLADLATMKNPTLTVYEKRVEADLYEWKKNKFSIFNNIGASFNLNEGNLRSSKDSALANLFYPRYNLNLTLPLSTFFAKPKETKRARANYEGSIAMKEVETQNLKTDVKRAYQIYITNNHLLRLQETVLQDEIVLYNTIQEKFEKNQVSLDLFTNSTKRYNDEIVKKINLTKEVYLARIHLESLLGMSLEEAMRAIMQR